MGSSSSDWPEEEPRGWEHLREKATCSEKYCKQPKPKLDNISGSNVVKQTNKTGHGARVNQGGASLSAFTLPWNTNQPTTVPVLQGL